MSREAANGLRRRSWLVGATVLFSLTGCSLIPPIPKRPEPKLDDAIGWIRLEGEGRATLFCPRMEMGQQVHRAMRRLVARELGLPGAAVTVRSPSTADIPLAKATVGSDSMRELAPLVVQACAMLRRSPAPAAPRASSTPASAEVPRFAADVRLPGLRHACVLRSPWRRELGARLEAVDDAALAAVPGFIRRLDLAELDGPALVADHPGALLAARAAAKPRWTAPPDTGDVMAMIDIDAALAAGRLTKDRGEVEPGAWSVDLRLDVPAAAHAAIEPRCAVARFAPDGSLEVWCGTQDPFYVRDVLARDHGLAVDRVIVHAMRLGGSFGGRTIASVEREAAWIARAIGAPVKLQWSREDEFTGAFHRPPSSHRVRLRLGADGMISDAWHALSSSHVLFTNAVLPAWMQRATDLIGDDGTARGQHAPYAVARQRRSLTLTRLPIATGPWRGLGAGPNVLAIESAMDAAARLAGADPVGFRLRHLERAVPGEHLGSPQRLAAVLRRVAVRAAGVPMAAPRAGERIGRGVACGVYKGRSYAAAVAEVSVRDDTIRVLRLWCSHDCGAIVDASGVRAQVEGNLVWSIGLVLSDELPVPDGRPAIDALAAYALPRIDAMPRLDIDLVESNEPAAGAGETAIVAGPGAILNAIVAATGVRPTRLPVRPQELANRS
jgi:isoquinoline 1-oxidoreductase beta subunit